MGPVPLDCAVWGNKFTADWDDKQGTYRHPKETAMPGRILERKALTGSEIGSIESDAYRKSTTLPHAELAAYVLENVPAQLATAAVGLRDARTVRAWAEGREIKENEAAHKLQVLFRVVYALVETYGRHVAAAFLRGSSPSLGDRAPLAVLATSPAAEAEPSILSALRALLEG